VFASGAFVLTDTLGVAVNICSRRLAIGSAAQYFDAGSKDCTVSYRRRTSPLVTTSRCQFAQYLSALQIFTFELLVRSGWRFSAPTEPGRDGVRCQDADGRNTIQTSHVVDSTPPNSPWIGTRSGNEPMRSSLSGIAFAAFALSSMLAAAAVSKPMESAKSRACWVQADQHAPRGAARTTFHANCMKATVARSPSPAKTVEAKAVTAPSGAEKSTRAQQCEAQAATRGLHDSALQAFRQACLASAAPVGAVGSTQHQPTPTAAKPKLDALTDAPPR
jgi:hypothetical protein